MSLEPKTVVLLSGGLDSATALGIARSEGRACHTLTFDYGQRCAAEIDATRHLAAAMNVVEHRIVRLSGGWLGGSALTGDLDVPKEEPPAAQAGRVPITYVPARNIIFLSHALAWAETLGAGEIYIGVNAIDYSGYPDCRGEFIAAYQKVIDVGTRAGVEGRGIRVRAPLLDMPKHEIIRRGLELGVDYALTMSCYDPDDGGLSCGRCESCRLRLAAFARLGIKDPIPYAIPV
jgi:7-cyano-7-deazaguanine synthase